MALEEISMEEGVQRLDRRSANENSGKTRSEAEPWETKISRSCFGCTWEHPVPKGVYISGAHRKLGDVVPNRAAMYDDGSHGDQRAGDSVWSYATTFAPGTKLFYVYTNSGEEGKWEWVDVPYIRSLIVEAKGSEGRIYRPIETFGKIYMQEALLEVLKRNEKLRAYLRHLAPANRS